MVTSIDKESVRISTATPLNRRNESEAEKLFAISEAPEKVSSLKDTHRKGHSDDLFKDRNRNATKRK